MTIKSHSAIILSYISLFIIIHFALSGCAGNKVYVDTDQVPGMGVEVHLPSGKVLPIEVKRVISGSSIELTNKELVSYIGVYIPQLHNIPRSAKSLNEKLLLKNQIRLEFDERRRDSRGRLMAYVYLLDGEFVNAKIIKEGLAKALLTPPNLKYKELLLKAEEDARKERLGIWSEEFEGEVPAED